jgi:hypothetical protein
LSNFAATVLETGSAFAILASQTLYAAQPLLEPWVAGTRLTSLAELLEDPKRTREFAQFLRQEPR